MKRPASVVGGVLFLLFGFAFVGIIGSCLITIAIWPGQIKLLAPFFCSDAQPDAFVVADTYSPQPGETVTNFSLYCMGPRGDSTDHGFLVPFLMISVVNGIVLMTIFVLLGRLGSRAGSRSREPKIPLADRLADDDDSATPPFGPTTTTGGPNVGVAPGAARSGVGTATSTAIDDPPDPPDPPRRPNQAPPGSTPGPFVG